MPNNASDGAKNSGSEWVRTLAEKPDPRQAVSVQDEFVYDVSKAIILDQHNCKAGRDGAYVRRTELDCEAEEMILAARAKIRGVVRSERRCERAGWASELGKLKVVVLRLTKQNYASAIVRLPSQEGLERRIEMPRDGAQPE